MEAKQKQDLFVQDPIEDIIKITGGLGRWQLLIIFLTTWSCVIAGNYKFCVFFGIFDYYYFFCKD